MQEIKRFLTLTASLVFCLLCVSKSYAEDTLPELIVDIYPEDSEQKVPPKELTIKLKETVASLHRIFRFTPQKTPKVLLVVGSLSQPGVWAPQWASALYSEKKVFIKYPLSKKEEGILIHSFRHEYVHFIVDELTLGRSPAWLDEGLAQYLEGSAIVKSPKVLKQWFSSRREIPLSELSQTMFHLNEENLPAGYAQALYATSALLQRHGITKILDYFEKLKSLEEPENAFVSTFHITETALSQQVGTELSSWAMRAQYTYQ